MGTKDDSAAARRLDPCRIDDSTRPRVAGSVELTPRPARSVATHLQMVHDHFRQQLEAMTRAVEEPPRRRPATVGDVRETLHRLAPALSAQQVPGLCRQVCRFLTMHHTFEDQAHVPGRRDPRGVRPGGGAAGRGAPRHPRPPRARRRPRRGRAPDPSRVAELVEAVARAPPRTWSRTSPTRRPRWPSRWVCSAWVSEPRNLGVGHPLPMGHLVVDQVGRGTS